MRHFLAHLANDGTYESQEITWRDERALKTRPQRQIELMLGKGKGAGKGPKDKQKH